MKVKITSVAANHLRAGYHFYEEQEQGAGVYFYECLLAEIDKLTTIAGVHAKYWGKYHRMICSPHPYAVFYKVDGDLVAVMAVVDCRRKPAFIKRTLKTSED